MKPAAALSAFALVVAAADSSAEIAPQPGLTKARAEAVFGLDLLFPCITHVQREIAIADLPPEYRSDLLPATDSEVMKKVGRDSVTATWTSKVLGSHLKVAEVGPAKCVIVADQLPVDETLRKASEATQRLTPPFTAAPVKPGYYPVVYETRGVLEGRPITVRLEGAEPGVPGHLFRFSLLIATVTATPAGG